MITAQDELNELRKVHRALHLAMANLGIRCEQYRDALRFIANHTAEPDTPLATVVNFARLTLEEETKWAINSPLNGGA